MMKRLIDDMSATVARLYRLKGERGFREGDLVGFEHDVDACIEELYAPMPEWKDKLDPDDPDTWVLCFVSDYSATSRECAVWVTHCEIGPYPFTTVPCGLYKYATPVDLNIRYEV